MNEIAKNNFLLWFEKEGNYYGYRKDYLQSWVGSWTSQTSLMPPIDRSRRDLSIGGIRVVWEVQEHVS